jgi:hypothetical protein
VPPAPAANASAVAQNDDDGDHDASEVSEDSGVVEPPAPQIDGIAHQDEVVFNTFDTADELVDDTFEGDYGEMKPPAGYVVLDKTEVNMAISSLTGKRLLIGASLTAAGTPGWVTGTVQGGPSDPTDRQRGITMRIKWTSRADPNVHRLWLAHKIVDACFELDTYGLRWFVLKST